MANIIDGKAIAAKILADVRAEISAKGLTPGLAVVLVGDNPASHTYVKNKKKACAEVGIKSFDHTLPADTKEVELLELIERLNADNKVHGILVQLPLPGHIDSQKVLTAINPAKDVDGFHPMNLGRLLIGRGQSPSPTHVGEPLSGLPEGGHGGPPLLWSPRPCTPLGIMELIASTGFELKGKHAVVVGRSNIVGKPVAVMLLEKHATVTICHSRTVNLPDVVRSADVLVAAIGKPQFIKGDWIKNGAIVIDVGINRTPEGKLVGDVEFDAAAKRAGWITPVPGGVGPMTIAMLLKNTVLACWRLCVLASKRTDA